VHYFRHYNTGMSKITRKYQLTLPKAVAEGAGYKPGDDVVCESSGETIYIRQKATGAAPVDSTTDRLVLFDLATERQAHRQRLQPKASKSTRGWTREDLYEP
jgi:AbrB family looped-hinge helix DNA binding protein